ncbi:MAG: DNA adenine methylase [Armatimonadota bacterium]|nr:DNA adenine methylase [bacterium]MDW8320224.1 DNA adenine methylase [Armatimonadota bacterium]
MVRSPLRFPGGKSRAIEQILPLVPEFEEYREPMVGGGSVFLALRQRFPDRRFWINDINYELYCFWKVLQERPHALVEAVNRIRAETRDGKALFYQLLARYGEGDELERAVRFFVLNRITFSGTVDSGGYSEQAFRGRFTVSAIERLRQVAPLLKGVRITCGDYEPVLHSDGKGVFLFLDPPYYSATDSRLYGKRGELHLGFDHYRLARLLRETQHNWLLTYDDSPFVRELYSDYTQVRWTLQYGMNNYKQPTARPGEELFIANYPIQAQPEAQLCLVFERRMQEYSPKG